MKKLLVFILALVMMLSITTVSFAKISNYQIQEYIPEFEEYIGFWHGDSIKFEGYKFSITIGQVESIYVAVLTTVKTDNNEMTSSIYSLAFDIGSKAAYLINDNDITYKAVLEDKQLVIYDMWDNELYAKLNRID